MTASFRNIESLRLIHCQGEIKTKNLTLFRVVKTTLPVAFVRGPSTYLWGIHGFGAPVPRGARTFNTADIAVPTTPLFLTMLRYTPLKSEDQTFSTHKLLLLRCRPYPLIIIRKSSYPASILLLFSHKFTRLRRTHFINKGN